MIAPTRRFKEWGNNPQYSRPASVDAMDNSTPAMKILKTRSEFQGNRLVVHMEIEVRRPFDHIELNLIIK
jgi:hypothetical protein